MSPELLQIDLPAALGGVLAAVVCALVGNFLVLARKAMLADATSHVVLPGVVGAFVLTGSTATLAMLGGAGVAVVLAAVAVKVIERLGVEPGTALGIVFTTAFAGGVLALEWTGVGRTAFDVHHVLFGNVEALIWPTATGPGSLIDPAALADLPAALGRLGFGVLVVAAGIALFFKELRLATFDPVYAATIGFAPGRVTVLVTVLAALATVVALEAVGAILVVAMFVGPPATARLLTDDLKVQVWLSAAIAGFCGLAGYALAGFGPGLVGFPIALNGAGTIALVAMLVLAGVTLARGRR